MVSSPNPIDAFLEMDDLASVGVKPGSRSKVASSTRVRPHTRRVGGKLVHVEGHDRDTEDAPETGAASTSRREAREAADMEAWRRWKQTKSDKDLQVLMERFAPMIRSRASVFMGKVPIDDATVLLTFKMAAAEAFRKFDPTRGAKLGTYVYGSLSRGPAQRWITAHQNVGRIPEDRIYKIREFQSVRDRLSDELDEEPTDAQLAKSLRWDIREVVRMRKELRNDLVAQGFEEDPYAFVPSKDAEVLSLFKYELEEGSDERKVFELMTAPGGKRVTSTGELGKILGVPDYTVSRIKSRLARKLTKYTQD